MSVSTVAVMLAIIVAGGIAIAPHVRQAAAPPPEQTSLCSLDPLSNEIRSRLSRELGSWIVQTAARLSPLARQRWDAEKPLTCPGIAAGYFDGSQALSYAILLVPQATNGKGHRLLVLGGRQGTRRVISRVIDRSADSRTSNYFIHSIPVSTFFDEMSRKRIAATASEGILLIDAGENEYGADVYYWTGSRYERRAVDY